MNVEQVIEARTEAMLMIRDALSHRRGELSAERNRGVLEALLSTTSIFYAMQEQIPVEVLYDGEMAGAALRGMADWYAEWKKRN